MSLPTTVLAMNLGLCSQFSTIFLNRSSTSGLAAWLIALMTSLIIAPPKFGARARRAILNALILATVQSPDSLCPVPDPLCQELEPVPYVYLAVPSVCAERIAMARELSGPEANPWCLARVFDMQPSPLAYSRRRGRRRYCSTPGTAPTAAAST